jgi:hypothetical protein
MPNHVQLVLSPTRADSLGLAVGEAHRRLPISLMCEGAWNGHLFQSRFSSVAMDDLQLLAAVSYVSLNPVRAGLTRYAADWAWSSVRAHLAGKDDGLVTVRPVLDRVSCFSDLLLEDRDEAFAALRRAGKEVTDRQCVGVNVFCVHEPQHAGHDPSFRHNIWCAKFYLRHTAGRTPSRAKYGDSLPIAANSTARPRGSPRLRRHSSRVTKPAVPSGRPMPSASLNEMNFLHNPLTTNPEKSANGRAQDAQTPGGHPHRQGVLAHSTTSIPGHETQVGPEPDSD